MARKATKLKQRPAGRAPGYEGTRALVAAVVDDPYDRTKLAVIKNTGGDPIEDMVARGLLDEAQWVAALRVRLYHERAGAVGAQAIDYGREHVDGGQVWVDVPLGQDEAAKEMAKVRSVLGALDYKIVVAIAGEGRRINEVAGALAYGTETDRRYVGKRFRDALDSLVVFWCLGSRAS